MLYQITAPDFCAGVRLDPSGYRVEEAAPKLYWMRGWNRHRIQSFCDFKGWFFTRVSK